MGAWGIKALESDNGLDVIDALEDYIAQKPEGKVELTLGEIIATFKGGLLGDRIEEIDFLYDNNAMALAELYLDFSETGEMNYDNEETEKSLRDRVKSFTADQASIAFVLRYLTDIRDEVPDDDGEREIVELWRESDSWDQWWAHLQQLIQQLEKEILVKK